MKFHAAPPGRQTPGLADRIGRLTAVGRYRTALGELLGILGRNPDDREALWLATVVLGTASRDGGLRAPEPLGRSQLWDCRLDRLFACCARCGISWVPLGVLYDEIPNLSFSSSTGLQCASCDVILCRNCVRAVHSDLDFSVLDAKCPACPQGTMGRTVYPTGRPRRQLPRRLEPVRQVIVLREGPVPPSEPYVEQLVEDRSPDAVEQNARRRGMELFPWPANPDGLEASILEIENAFKGEAVGDHFVDDDGTRVYMLKIFEREGTMTMKAVIELLKQCIGNMPATVPRGVRSKLMLEAVMLQTGEALSILLEQALARREHAAELHAGSQLALIFSAVPDVDPEAARRHFPHGYTTFLNDALKGQVAADTVHWTLCSDGTRSVLHCSWLPKDGDAVPLLATDLMTAAERADLGMS